MKITFDSAKCCEGLSLHEKVVDVILQDFYCMSKSQNRTTRISLVFSTK